MQTKEVKINGVQMIAPQSYEAPAVIGDCCGAGQGLGEKLVPDNIYGLRVSAACHIHDYSWEVAEPTEADLLQTNTMFLINLLAIIRAGSPNVFMRWLRSYRAVTYYNAVQDVGKAIFFALKTAADLSGDYELNRAG